MTSKHEPPKPPATIRDWLAQHGVGDVSLHHIARTLGKSHQVTEALLQNPVTSETLLNLNRLAQYRHLALANRVWPHCTWLEWRGQQTRSHPVIKLILDTFGSTLMKYVEKTFGDTIVLDYWSELKVPSAYKDIILDDEARDPLNDIPENQLIDNPHLDEEETGEFYTFGSPATAACFAWLIETRHNYSHYVDHRTGYLNDPLGIRLAYDLRQVFKEEYWAELPPDTLPSYLAIARSLHAATVPDEYQEGRLPPLKIIQVASLKSDYLAVAQVDFDTVWFDPQDTLVFKQSPINVFVLDTQIERSPAAIILTTNDEPGNPEQHRQEPVYQYLTNSEDTLALAFVLGKAVDIDQAKKIFAKTLTEAPWELHTETGAFCITRANPYFGEAATEMIPVYRIVGGYMLQLNPAYQFTPQEIDAD